MLRRNLFLFLITCLQTHALDVSGKILDISTGKPLFKATVFFGQESGVPISVITDREGVFKAQGLPEGPYMIAVAIKGYLPYIHGSPIPQTLGRPFLLNPLSSETPLLMRIIPTSVISGRILDQDGDPIEWLTIIALRQIERNGRKEWLQQGAGRTDPEGNYSINGLPPGNYRLLTQGGRTPLPNQVFPPTWHPASGAIRIQTGDKLPNTDIDLPLVISHRVSGRLLPPAGDQAKMYSLRLLPRDAPLTLLGLVNPSVIMRTSTGEFEAQSVPPGDYVLQAVREDIFTHEVALRMNLSVYSGQLDLLISPRPLLAIAGKIEMAKGSPMVELGKLQISLLALDTDLASTVRPIPVDPSGAFTIDNLSSARYRLSVSDSAGVPLIVETAEIDLSQSLPNPFILRVSATMPVVKLRAANAAAAFVSVLNGPMTAFMQTASTTLHLQPGRHSLLTFENIDVSLLSDPAMVNKLMPLAKTIEVKAGDKIEIEVPTLSQDQIEKLNHPL